MRNRGSCVSVRWVFVAVELDLNAATAPLPFLFLTSASSSCTRPSSQTDGTWTMPASGKKRDRKKERKKCQYPALLTRLSPIPFASSSIPIRHIFTATSTWTPLQSTALHCTPHTPCNTTTRFVLQLGHPTLSSSGSFYPFPIAHLSEEKIIVNMAPAVVVCCCC